MSTTHRPPMLLISADVEDTWNVYNVMDNKVLSLQVNLPNKRVCGSSNGWLITVEEDFAVILINPFFRVKGRRNKENSFICLPQLKPPPTERERIFWSKQCEIYVSRATMSAGQQTQYWIQRSVLLWLYMKNFTRWLLSDPAKTQHGLVVRISTMQMLFMCNLDSMLLLTVANSRHLMSLLGRTLI